MSVGALLVEVVALVVKVEAVLFVVFLIETFIFLLAPGVLVGEKFLGRQLIVRFAKARRDANFLAGNLGLMCARPLRP